MSLTLADKIRAKLALAKDFSREQSREEEGSLARPMTDLVGSKTGVWARPGAQIQPHLNNLITESTSSQTTQVLQYEQAETSLSPSWTLIEAQESKIEVQEDPEKTMLRKIVEMQRKQLDLRLTLLEMKSTSLATANTIIQELQIENASLKKQLDARQMDQEEHYDRTPEVLENKRKESEDSSLQKTIQELQRDIESNFQITNPKEKKLLEQISPEERDRSQPAVNKIDDAEIDGLKARVEDIKIVSDLNQHPIDEIAQDMVDTETRSETKVAEVKKELETEET